ncbi:MAG: hypothetical protein AB8I58_12640 [Anaerolineales bacterium]|jgi:histidine ammonia-lyase
MLNKGVTPVVCQKGTRKAREVIHRHVKHLDVDRPIYPDHNVMKELVKSGEILEEVEKVVGKLG